MLNFLYRYLRNRVSSEAITTNSIVSANDRAVTLAQNPDPTKASGNCFHIVLSQVSKKAPTPNVKSAIVFEFRFLFWSEATAAERFVSADITLRLRWKNGERLHILAAHIVSPPHPNDTIQQDTEQYQGIELRSSVSNAANLLFTANTTVKKSVNVSHTKHVRKMNGQTVSCCFGENVATGHGLPPNYDVSIEVEAIENFEANSLLLDIYSKANGSYLTKCEIGTRNDMFQTEICGSDGLPDFNHTCTLDCDA